jgi:hypothetical protein
MTFGLSKFLGIAKRFIMTILIACAVATAIWGGLIVLKHIKTTRLSNTVIQWMNAQEFPDRCEQQGEIAATGTEGMPCMTRNGYRFISGIERHSDDNQPLKRVVRITGERLINANDIVLTDQYNYKVRYREILAGTPEEFKQLLQAVPEIETETKL